MRILVVEDEQKLANSFKKALEAESYAVDVYFDGKEGFDAACVEEYDLIVLDIGLPTMDGVSIAKKLREEKVKTPILMLTAKDTLNDKVVGLDSGADDYVVKPFDFEEVLARMRALLRRRNTDSDLVYRVGSIELNPQSHIVKRSGKTIDLSAKEYALLEFLIRHGKQIVSKTQIMDHVWDMETDPFSNVVDVYMGYLRNKIDKAFPKEEPLLETIKGLGYRLGK